jgi:hypothetical protein
MSVATPTTTAEQVYEMAKQLAPAERLRLVEKIAHDLAPVPDTRARPARTDPPSTRVELLGQVTDLALDPPRFMVRVKQGPVSVQVPPDLLDAARDAWGKHALVRTDAVVDADGTVLHAVAVTIEPVPEIDDPLAIFEATFGSGADLWASPESCTHLEEMRGGV